MRSMETEQAGNGYAPQPASTRTELLRVDGVGKVYKVGAGSVTALRNVTLRLSEGEFIAIRGRSGAGKTTLLNIIAGLDDPTSGRVSLFGRDLASIKEADRTVMRRSELGFMFQSAHLIPTLTARENVGLLLRLANAEPAERERRAHEALALVGLAAREEHRAPELSGGEQQRVAIARAIVANPSAVLADEPTSALDGANGQMIMRILASIAHERNNAVLVVSHDPRVVPLADRIIHIEDGLLIEEPSGGPRLPKAAAFQP